MSVNKMKAYDRYYNINSDIYNKEKAGQRSRSIVIQFKVSDELYNSLKSDADKEHLSVNLYVKKRMTESVHGQTGLTPEILLKLTGLYNMLTLPACKWNDDMKNSYDAEMGRLYGELFR